MCEQYGLGREHSLIHVIFTVKIKRLSENANLANANKMQDCYLDYLYSGYFEHLCCYNHDFSVVAPCT